MIGFSEGFHDAAVAVVCEGGKICFATHSERYSRIKHDKVLDETAVNVAKCFTNDDTVAFYERPWLKKTRQFFAGQNHWKKHRLASTVHIRHDIVNVPSQYAEQNPRGKKKIKRSLK